MIKNRLAILLAERQLKITKVAKDTGISRNTITSTVQNDGTMIKLDTIETLCNYLNIEPKDFFEYSPFNFKFGSINFDLEVNKIEFILKTTNKNKDTGKIVFHSTPKYTINDTEVTNVFSLNQTEFENLFLIDEIENNIFKINCKFRRVNDTFDNSFIELSPLLLKEMTDTIKSRIESFVSKTLTSDFVFSSLYGSYKSVDANFDDFTEIEEYNSFDISIMLFKDNS
ncbi:helix-turn-helix domain-containing protein [Streptococcus uberis]|uniref:helix-turn-helix domain-containing protein n=1 Tax=Streptococcus uberis TaxID=1349 RepID=UPI001939382E|nr:helix-turn-helix transcriptional regulator [Streptococcus uberis]